MVVAPLISGLALSTFLGSVLLLRVKLCIRCVVQERQEAYSCNEVHQSLIEDARVPI